MSENYTIDQVLGMLAICEEQPDHPEWATYMAIATKFLKKNGPPRMWEKFRREAMMKLGVRPINRGTEW